MTIFLVSSLDRRTWKATLMLIDENMNPGWRVPPSSLNNLPKDLPPTIITLGFRNQHMNFKVTQTFGL
jgi:hypothetical protein